MLQYVQMGFRDNRTLDERNARLKLTTAEQELADMNALHDMREARDAPEPGSTAEAYHGPFHATASPQQQQQQQQQQRQRQSNATGERDRQADIGAGDDARGAVSTISCAVSTGALPGIVAATVAVIGRTDFFERAIRGEDLSLTLTADQVRAHLMASQQDELACWREVQPETNP